MKSLRFPRLFTLLLLCWSAGGPAFAQDSAAPYVATPLEDFTVEAGAAPTVLKLKNTFGLTGVNEVVRFTTNLVQNGAPLTVDVALLSTAAPRTVATFLTYANAAGDNTTGVYSYGNTLIQRAVSNFVVQGGGFYLDAANQINQIIARPAIPGEPGVRNTRGTIAMALSTGPDSATGDYFFNVNDNTNLDDSSNGGPFTVFGRVVGGLSTLDAIEALPQDNFSQQLGDSFRNVPLVNYDPAVNTEATPQNLLQLASVTTIPLVAKKAGGVGVLAVKVSNSNPGLVTATLSGQKLRLVYTPGATGTAKLKVKGTATVAGVPLTAKAKFTVTVQ